MSSTDYYEIDFLNVESKRSGDAIPLRYQTNGETRIHVVDGGFQSNGEKLVKHIRRYYGNPHHIHHVVATHNDGDHAGGLRELFDEFAIGTLWMLRPWMYANELLPRFARYGSADNLHYRLRSLYPNLAELEDLANETGTPIEAPFQGARIGEFFVVAPSRQRFLDLVVQSERTPEVSAAEREVETEVQGLLGAFQRIVQFVEAKWLDEKFSEEETSAENEMSVVQYAYIADKSILLTGDTGRGGLAEAGNWVMAAGVTLPGVDVFQVPHHGSRRNVSTELLDLWLGERMLFTPKEPKFIAVISASEEDKDHPRKAVVRACYHRGGGEQTWSNQTDDLCIHNRSPFMPRAGWGSAVALPYPPDQEA